jgi:two-component system response regulator
LNTSAQELTWRYDHKPSSDLEDESGADQMSTKAPNSSSQSHPESSVTAKQSNAYILLVEDNGADVTLIRQSLKEHSVDLELALVTDGQVAVHYLNMIANKMYAAPALVILDLNLPKMSGLEVLRQMRATDGCAKLPVVVFSSSDAARDRAEASRLGANQYIRKPSNLDEFSAVGAILKRLLSGASD